MYQKVWDYEELFGETPERVEVPNKSAGGLFGRYLHVLERDILLHIARLTDPHEMNGHRNLSIEAMMELIDEPRLSLALDEKLATSKEKAKFARIWRNLTLAHSDYNLLLGAPGARTLAPSSRKQWKDSVESIASVLKCVCEHYCDAEISFDRRDNGEVTHLVSLLDSKTAIDR